MHQASDMSLTVLSTLWEYELRSGIFSVKLLAIKVRISSFKSSCISGQLAPSRSLTFTMSCHSVVFLSFVRVATWLLLFAALKLAVVFFA